MGFIAHFSGIAPLHGPGVSETSGSSSPDAASTKSPADSAASLNIGGPAMADESSRPDSNLRFPHWQAEYQAALLETDSKKLQESISRRSCHLRAFASAHSQFGRACRAASHRGRHACSKVRPDRKAGLSRLEKVTLFVKVRASPLHNANKPN
jgi:hypothetical protein